MGLNLEDLRKDIKRMTRRTKLFKALKEELTLKGYWKNKARGKPNPNISRFTGTDTTI